MHLVRVNSLSSKNIIAQLAKEFEIEFQEKYGECKLELPSKIGHGYIKCNSFKNGTSLLCINAVFNSSVKILIQYQKIHPLKFIYCLDGQLNYSVCSNEEPLILYRYQHAIVSTSSKGVEELNIQKGKRIQLFSLEIFRNKFLPTLSCEVGMLGNRLEQVFKDVKGHNCFCHQGLYSLKLADFFREILSFRQNHFVSNIFLEGQTYKILSQQILEYEREIDIQSSFQGLRQKEINLIKEAASIIENELSESPSIGNLVSRTGLNANKLQFGFKMLYGFTINRYIRKKRLETAKNLLENTDYNISETASKVGITSVSYFSKIFKEEYQVKPSTLIFGRKKQQLA
jgi:AraC-like DNA-binding protein